MPISNSCCLQSTSCYCLEKPRSKGRLLPQRGSPAWRHSRLVLLARQQRLLLIVLTVLSGPPKAVTPPPAARPRHALPPRP